jgi:uncharacterized protein (DUF2336 family)
MIVRQFLQWVRQAPPGERAEATSALARAYLYSDLSPDDLAAAEGAMIMLLDDPSPLVRRALSEVFASCEQAPQVVVHALAAQPDVAMPVLCFRRCCGKTIWLILSRPDEPKHRLPSRNGAC